MGISAGRLKTANWTPRHVSARSKPAPEPESEAEEPLLAGEGDSDRQDIEKPPDIVRPKHGQAPIGKLDARTAARLAGIRLKYQEMDQGESLRAAILSCLPRLHKKQQEIADSPAKRKVVNTGRRVGKTTMAAVLAVRLATQGRRVLLASPLQKQADAFWIKCKTWLAPFIDSGEVIKNETKRTLEFPAFGGHITARTASDPDSLRGDYADDLFLDECALLDSTVAKEVGAPMLLDKDGNAYYLSTPRRRNWFYVLAMKAKTDTTGRWAYFTFSSHENPYLSKAALAEIADELTDEQYRQEIEAEFLEGEGAVFHEIAANMTAPVTDPGAHVGHFLVGGGDWGKTHDYTVFSILCVTCRCEVYLDRFNKNQWAEQRRRIRNAYYLWRPHTILFERNSIGDVNIEALQNGESTQEGGPWEPGIPVEGFDTTRVSKPQLVQGMKLCLERHLYRWLDDPAGTAELEAYEAKTSRITGHTSYSAPDDEEMHDDTVMARMIALHAAETVLPTVGPSAVSHHQIAAGAQAASHGESLPILPSIPGTAGGYVPSFASAPTYSAGYNQAMPAPPGKPW